MPTERRIRGVAASWLVCLLIGVSCWSLGFAEDSVVASGSESACDEYPPTRAASDFTVEFDASTGGLNLGSAQWTVGPTEVPGEYRFLAKLGTQGVAQILYPVGTTSETLWRFDEQGRVQPLRYEYRHSRREKRNLSVRFDWDRRTVTASFQDQTRSDPLADETYDNQLFMLELGLRAAAGEREIHFYTVGNRKTSERAAWVEGCETILNDGEALATWKLSYADDDKQTSVWYAPSLHFLPVLIDYNDADGMQVQLKATAVRFGDTPPIELDLDLSTSIFGNDQ